MCKVEINGGMGDVFILTKYGGLKECCITIQRGGKITKSATAVPGSNDGHVSTV